MFMMALSANSRHSVKALRRRQPEMSQMGDDVVVASSFGFFTRRQFSISSAALAFSCLFVLSLLARVI